MGSTNHKLGIVILNWNDEEGSTCCLRSLSQWKATAPAIIVVDNASTDGSAAAIEAAFPTVHLVRCKENRGYAGGNNVGIEKARQLGCHALLLLNSDAEIAEDDVLALRALLLQQEGPAVAGPAIEETSPHGKILTWGGRDIAKYSRTRITAVASRTEGNEKTLHAVDYVPGTILLTTLSVVDRVGTLDEAYFFSGEIADFCARARDLGIPCLIDTTVIARHGDNAIHPLRSTLYLYYTLRNRFLYADLRGGQYQRRNMLRWTAEALLMLALSLVTFKLAKSRAIILALQHGLTKQWGNQNDRFRV
jgi:GT2 family glycosyltransferase